MRALLPFTLLMLLSACATSGRQHMPAAQLVLNRSATPDVGTYVSTDRGFATSSYWIEGPTGLIMIDTQFLLSAAEESLNWAERVTGKKVELAVVLHPNPDKFNGVGIFKKRGIKVISSDDVIKEIPAVHTLRKKWFYERFKPEFPADYTLPDSFGNRTTELTAGGAKIKLHVLRGPGCSKAHVVVQYGQHLFTGDLVSNGGHAWLEIGEAQEWIKRLDELMELDPDYVHPGRGPSGGYGLLLRQQAYLEKVLAIVKAAKPRPSLSEQQRKDLFERLANQIYDAYPGYDFGMFVEIGLPELWDKLAKQR